MRRQVVAKLKGRNGRRTTVNGALDRRGAASERGSCEGMTTFGPDPPAAGRNIASLCCCVRHDGAMQAPTSDQFRALARSSPWRWQSLVFDFTSDGSGNWSRCWLRRPDAIRVESGGGELLFVDGPEAHRPFQLRLALSVRRALCRPDTEESFRPTDPRAPQPVLDERGLVARRPAEIGGLRYDDPMYQDYHWVAMLDPVELADGLDQHGNRATSVSPVQLEDVTEVEHHGRAAWQAIAIPTCAYGARCPCCPLLDSGPAAARAEAVFGREARPGVGHDDDTAHCVRIDVGTGVCVYNEQLIGEHRGDGHDLRIEDVDLPLPERLFIGRSP